MSLDVTTLRQVLDEETMRAVTVCMIIDCHGRDPPPDEDNEDGIPWDERVAAVMGIEIEYMRTCLRICKAHYRRILIFVAALENDEVRLKFLHNAVVSLLEIWGCHGITLLRLAMRHMGCFSESLIDAMVEVSNVLFLANSGNDEAKYTLAQWQNATQAVTEAANEFLIDFLELDLEEKMETVLKLEGELKDEPILVYRKLYAICCHCDRPYPTVARAALAVVSRFAGRENLDE
ncbi:hypothetical pox protein [Squirrelpox virus]|uniref:Hypothetical pox protein n=1 Tax=Squirrelpox virus TaxID=240426 RepID=U3UBF6_9POXV|nr:hypothetical pox protein [Squirrelpox virus]CCD83214.1 hypothetical pox protein [Squirrelpox virus]